MIMWVASASSAETVNIQTGNHSNFTRIVFDLPADGQWELVQLEKEVAIFIPSATSFLTEEFFRRIDRSRIQEFFITNNSSTFSFTLNCSCNVEPYLLDDVYLVVDIYDPIIDQAPEQPPKSNTKTPSEPMSILTDTIQDLLQPWHKTAQLENADNAPSNPNQIETAFLKSLDQIISEGLAGATYQGLLSIDPQNRERQQTTIVEDTINNSQIGIATQTSNQSEVLQPGSTRRPPAICAIGDQFKITDWIGTASFNIVLGEIHSRLDVQDPQERQKARTELIQLYLAYGLSDEASQVLESLPNNTPQREIYDYIAATIAEDPPMPEDPEFILCKNDLAIWGFVRSHQAEMGPDPAQLLLTFKSLPVPLQRQIRSQLIIALKRAGHDQYVAEIDEFRSTIAAASSARNGGSNQVAIETSTTPVPLPKELKTALDELNEIIPEISPADVATPDRIGSLRVEYRNSEAEQALLELELNRRLEASDFQNAWDLVQSTFGTEASKESNALFEKFLDVSLAKMEDAAFVALVFRQDFPEVSSSFSQRISQRLNSIGIGPSERYTTDPPQKNQTVGSSGRANQDEVLAPFLGAETGTVTEDTNTSSIPPMLATIADYNAQVFQQLRDEPITMETSQDILENSTLTRRTIQELLEIEN